MLSIDPGVFTSTLVDLWRKEYPGYEENLQQLRPWEYRDHMARVDICYRDVAKALVIAVAQAQHWPFRSEEWLEYVLSRGISPRRIARKYHVPTFVVRFYCWRFGLAPVGGAQGFLWALGKRPKAVAFPTVETPPLAEQASFEDWIFVRPEGGQLFIPAEEVLAGRA